MSHTDSTGLTGGTTRRYRIRAENSKGDGGWSLLASATTAVSVPGKPTLTVNGVPSGVHVFWTTPATPTGGSAIIRFEVQRWDSASQAARFVMSVARFPFPFPFLPPPFLRPAIGPPTLPSPGNSYKQSVRIPIANFAGAFDVEPFSMYLRHFAYAISTIRRLLSETPDKGAPIAGFA